MTANWLSGWRYKYPPGYGDVEPMLAQGKPTEKAPDSDPNRSRQDRVPRAADHNDIGGMR